MNTRIWKKDWFAELAIAVEGHSYAHQQIIVHRDIKPANIMYAPEIDSIKITDFGITRITVSSKTKTGTIPVTPAGRPPEQVASQKVDGRPDLFSPGVTLLQLLSGSMPFQADSMVSSMFKTTDEAVSNFKSVRPDITDAIASVARKILLKGIKHRFQPALGNHLKAVLAYHS
jgi:serine/threonine-protein kinase